MCFLTADESDNDLDCGDCPQQCEFIEEVAHFFCSFGGKRSRQTKYVFFSMNCQLLRGCFPGQGGHQKYLFQRASCLANRLASCAEYVDIICLQECFEKESRGLLIRKLLHYFPHYAEGKEGSGLLTMAKFPVRHSMFHTFQNASSGEWLFFNKGILACSFSDPEEEESSEEQGLIESSAAGTVLVFNTHLQSDFWRKSIEEREKQAEEIRDFRELVMNSKQFCGVNAMIDCAVLCGDLNVHAGSAEAEALFTKLGVETFVDTLAWKVPAYSEEEHKHFLHTFPECTYKPRKGRYDVSTESKARLHSRLDYVLECSGDQKKREKNSRVVRSLKDHNDIPLSDHRAIISAVERVYV